MTISLAAVLVPILFMGGVVGRLFEEFGVVIIVAITISGIVSLTLTPMLCSRFIRPMGNERHGFVYRAIESFFHALLGGYRRSLDWVLRHRAFVMFFNLLILAATVYVAKLVPGGFIPDDDKDQIFAVTETAQGTAVQRRMELQGKVADVLRDDPNIEAFFSGIGGVRSAEMGGQNMGRMFMHLKPREERSNDVYGVIQSLRAKLRPYTADIGVYMQNPPNVRIGGMLTKSQYQFALQSTDLDELYRVAPQLEAKMRAMPELQDVTSDLQIKNPELSVSIDRDKAAALGVSPQQVEAMLSNGYAQRWISTIYAQNNQYKVLLELDPKFQGDPALLSKLYVKSTSGQLIRLDTIAKLEKGAGVQSIAHLAQLPAVTISFNLKPGSALGDAVTKIQTLARETLPPSITTAFQGSAQAFQAAFKGMGIILIISVIFIYLVLGILYESFIHPLTILSGLPSAGLGALLTLYFFHLDLNVYSCVGLVMLIGIVKKNAIMQIDFAIAAQRDHAKSPIEAIREGCLIRFRPIMMTTMAALLGTLPIAFSHGVGAESRRPLGLVVVGGLLTSQLITLYLTPVFYVYMDKLQTWLGRFRRRNESPAIGHDLPINAD
jgi:HAE1 family hydrophobic/amphiphilic exporter-1